MNWNFLFFMNSALLGVGLAMDAFSVSLANGMNEKKMKKQFRNYGLVYQLCGILAIEDTKEKGA